MLFKDCDSFLFITNVLVIPLVSLVGILLNALSIVVFYKIVNQEKLNGSHMFKYLLFKSIYDEIQFLVQIFAPFYYYKSFATYQTYVMQVWYIWFYYYIESISELCSGLLELAATFDCLINLRKKLNFFTRDIFFKSTVVSTLLFSSFFYLFRLFDFKINKKQQQIISNNNNNNNRKNSTSVPFSSASAVQYYFVTESSDFSTTRASELLKSMHTLMRDALIVILLIIFNLMILSTLKKSIKNKRKLLQPLVMTMNTTVDTSFGKDSSNENNETALIATNENADVAAAATGSSQTNSGDRSTSINLLAYHRNRSRRYVEQVERKTTIMVTLTGVNYILGHFPSILFYLPLGLDTSDWICLRHVNLIFFYASYVIPFFLYVSFNNLFRSYLYRTLECYFYTPSKTSSTIKNSVAFEQNN